MTNEWENLFHIPGKVAIVTGGTSGLGYAIAEAFLHNGVDVITCSRRAEQGEPLAQLAKNLGRRFLAISVDITDEAAVDQMLETVSLTFDRVDILVNSAGMNILKPAESYDMEAFETVMRLNVSATHLMCRKVASKWMIPQGGGKIVNLSSAKAFLAVEEDYAAYCASKGAINMYTKQLGCEWAKYHINVNAVAPTFVKTPINADRLENPVFYNELVERIPARRLGTGKDIAAATLFLCSEGADFITGVTLPVDGGITARQ